VENLFFASHNTTLFVENNGHNAIDIGCKPFETWHSLTIPRCHTLHRDEILPGTLYLSILKTLVPSGEMHGYEIANSIQRISDDVLQVEEGSLYPALQRMLIKGSVTAKWGTTAGNRRARYYQLSPAGRRQLAVEMSQFERVIGAITRVIEAV
jgi:PadR family transcriptional regulator, regulatory protein PadR